MIKINEESSDVPCRLELETTWIAEGLVHAIEHIDIYSSSWGSKNDFNDFLNRSYLIADALRTGINKVLLFSYKFVKGFFLR